MRHTMRLMGKHRLCELANGNGGSVGAAVAALSLELEAAEWAEPSDALELFPKADLSGCRVQIPLHDGYLVIIALNCVAGIALVEFAGHAGGCA